MKKRFLAAFFFSSLLFYACSAQTQVTKDTEKQINPGKESIYDTVRSDKSDLGKLWTFDFPPKDHVKAEYDFVLTDEWLLKARQAALKFGGGCTASFVSEDGLIMTNHHCGRGDMLGVQKPGEDLLKTGFYAASPEEERKVPGLEVDQLMLIKDVTDEIKAAINSGTDDADKIGKKRRKMSELEDSYSAQTKLVCKVVQLYNGGKYSLYGYKRYSDIRLVFAPEFQIASTGWDYDNFTYPRYELDFMFFRAYDENGKPYKTTDYFKWNFEGAEEGEPIFVIGNPGRTGRLQTMAQLEYLRDIQYPTTAALLRDVYNAYFHMFKKYPERESELLNYVMSIGNSRKVYEGMLAGLRDPYLFARKKDFEERLKSKVESDAALKSKYSNLWNEIEAIRTEMRQYAPRISAYNISTYTSSPYFVVARKLVNMSEAELKQSDSLVKAFTFNSFVSEIGREVLAANIAHLERTLGRNDSVFTALTGGRTGTEAVKYIISNSEIADSIKLKQLIEGGKEAVRNSKDPFLRFVMSTREKLQELQDKVKLLNAREQLNNQLLGEAVYDIYGYSVPPDATGTLRLSDGVIKGYEYNGTLAPAKTTYYGMYDRYHSFDKKYPWGLPELWQKKPAELNLEYPLDFASTNDIIGGNSGSAAVNRKLEVVGLVFDGNFESLAGDFIYNPENNRAVAIDSKGLYEAIKDVYKAERVAEELLNGKGAF